MTGVTNDESDACVSSKVEGELNLGSSRSIDDVERVASLGTLFAVVYLRGLACTSLVQWTQHLNGVIQPGRIYQSTIT
jgi:hypothetical protein